MLEIALTSDEVSKKFQSLGFHYPDVGRAEKVVVHLHHLHPKVVVHLHHLHPLVWHLW